jgi:hypothetical protein
MVEETVLKILQTERVCPLDYPYMGSDAKNPIAMDL